MWPITRHTTLSACGLLPGSTDWHCHLLPGVDDGFQSLADTLAALARYEEQGIAEVWLTPHVMEDIPNTPAMLRARFAALCEAYTGTVRLHLAAEHMLDALFAQRLAAADVLPIGTEGRHLLVETSCVTPPMGFRRMLDDILSRGFFPVLAHPERYRYMSEADYGRLAERHVTLQLNAFSLLGLYGPEARDRARHLLSHGLYTLWGTDLHALHVLTRCLRASLSKAEARQLAALQNTL